MMKNIIKITVCTIALSAALPSGAQCTAKENFAVKAHANIGLGEAVHTTSSLPGLDKKTSACDFGVDFGWTFWRRQNHSLEANIGAGYSTASLKLNVEDLAYTYLASSAADMDGDTYMRYYELEYLEQKQQLGRVVVPIYLSYAYRCNDWLGVHADLGVSLAFKVCSKMSSFSGEGYSCGVYPQYDNLIIDESYLNDFGSKRYSSDMVASAKANGFSCGILARVGAEFRIYGPLAADLSVGYDCGLTNLYKRNIKQTDKLVESAAPVNYLVRDGQRVKSLTDYLTASKLSRISVDISLIYQF